MCKWKIVYFDQHVVDRLSAWPKKIRAKYLRIVELIENHGLNLGSSISKPMGSGLFEIRVKAQEGIGRVFFCYKVNHEIVVLHAFIKKTDKTPKKELDIAYKRLNEAKTSWKN